MSVRSPALLAVAALAALIVPAAGANAAERPNFVLIQTDDARFDHAAKATMPRLHESVRRRGATFTSYVVPTPLCCPSRATLLSGRFAHNSGVRSNDPPLGGFGRLRQRATLNRWLRSDGYRTAHVGKFLNHYGDNPRPRVVPRGWDRWVTPPGGSAFRMYDYRLNVDGRLRSFGDEARDYQTDVLARYAKRFVRSSARRRAPFFLAVDPLAPHVEVGGSVGSAPCGGPRPAPRHQGLFADLELVPGPGYDEADVSDKPAVIADRPRLSAEQIERTECSFRRERESLLAVDELVAGLVGELREAGELRSTYVIFTSDNGYTNGEHRLLGGRTKASPYNESTRLPMLVRGPGIEPGLKLDRLASNVDLAPTILALAGARERAKVPLDGVSLAGYLKGGKAPGRRQLPLEFFDEAYWPPYRGAVGRNYVYWRYLETGEEELYHRADDPFQLRNLAEEPLYEGVRARLSVRAEALSACAGSACR